MANGFSTSGSSRKSLSTAPSPFPIGVSRESGCSAIGWSANCLDLIAHETPGTYYVGACVDAAPQEVNTANNCSSAVTIIVQS